MSAEAIADAFATLKRNDVAEIKALVKKSKHAVFWRDSYDQTMLHCAAFDGLLEMCELLVKYYKPADLKIRDKNGWQVLHCAASQGHLEIYELLLAKGASPNAQNGDLTSPFAYLCRYASVCCKRVRCYTQGPRLENVFRHGLQQRAFSRACFLVCRLWGGAAAAP
jgi:hypothetical protein